MKAISLKVKIGTLTVYSSEDQFSLKIGKNGEWIPVEEFLSSQPKNIRRNIRRSAHQLDLHRVSRTGTSNSPNEYLPGRQTFIGQR